ncbi:hypothetical protein Tco_0359843 [Tanacetum coccineum]
MLQKENQKYPHAQYGTPTSRKGQGKGYIRKRDMEINVPAPKKKRVAVPRHSETITFANNLLGNQDQALEYVKLVNEEENQQREKERRSQHRHANLVIEKQVNKEIDEGYKHLKVKPKAQEQASPKARLLLNLKKQTKESKKQRILEEIRKAPGDGSGVALDSLDHSDSLDNSIWNSTTDDKTESDKESDHGDDNEKSDNED